MGGHITEVKTFITVGHIEVSEMFLARPHKWETSISLQFASLYDGQIFIWSNCLLDLGTDFVAGNTVFARDACMQTLTMACMQTLMRMCRL